MGGLKKVPSEGGSGGKRGHSSMEHWAKTEEIKQAARRKRRADDKTFADEAASDEIPSEFIVASVSEISGRGAAVLFEDDPQVIMPLGPRSVRVLLPTGKSIQCRCSVEAARKVPPGEVLTILFRDLGPGDIPIGSIVTF